jgi:hypothetical protein
MGIFDRLLGAPQVLEIDLLRHAVVVQIGQVAERLGKGLGAPREVLVQRLRLKRQLLLEERGEHDRRGAGILHAANIVDRLRERRGRDHDRAAQLQAKILR